MIGFLKRFGEGMRGAVMRRRVWQDLMGWFRPHDREATIAPAMLQSAGDSRDADALLVSEFGEEEILDFLAGDVDPVPADPAFREELREQCWSLVQDGVTARPKDH